MMNWNECREKWPWPILRYSYQQYSQQMNETEINIRIADLQAILLTTTPRYSF